MGWDQRLAIVMIVVGLGLLALLACRK